MARYSIGLLAVIATALLIAPSGRLNPTAPPQASKSLAPPPVDLSGVWEANMPGLKWATYSFSPDLPPMTAWGKARYLAAKPSYGPRAVDKSTDYVNPTTGKDQGCLPPGVPRIYIQPFALEFIETPGRLVQLFEFDHHVRQIFTDGRQHPKDPDLTWMGDSIGWYEGDTLIVDTVGLNEKPGSIAAACPIPTSCTSPNAFAVLRTIPSK